MKNWCSDIGRLFLLVGLLSVVAMAAGPASPFKFRTESIPGAIETDIFGVNNSMVGVGAYVDSHGVRHGFMAGGGKVTTIDDPNGSNTYCFGINNLGAIVGYYATSNHNAQGFLYAKGKFTDISPTGSTGSQATGINDHGDITGNFADSKGSHGFLLKGGTYTTLDVPGAQARSAERLTMPAS